MKIWNSMHDLNTSVRYNRQGYYELHSANLLSAQIFFICNEKKLNAYFSHSKLIT